MTSEKVLICASCGSEEPEGSGFCGSCGARLVPAEAPSPTEVPAPEPAAESPPAGGATLTCASCGSEEPEGSVFCGSCGASLVPADLQSDEAPPVEPSTPAEVENPAVADAPTEVAPPPAPPSDHTTRPPDAAPPADSPRRRVRSPALIAVLVVLIAAVAAAVLFGTGVIGGSSGKSQSEFVLQVNQNVIGPLDQADQAAAEHASTADGASFRAADGSRIVQTAAQAAAYLRALSGLSGQQRGEVQLLLAFVAANQLYGQAFAALVPEDDQTQLALEGAAAATRSAIATVQRGLPELRLPSETAFISSPAAPPPTTTTTTTTTTTPTTTPTAPTTTAPSASELATVYVQQVDGLLSRSHAVVLGLRSFIPRATSDAISRGAAVVAARSFVDQRRLELEQAQALTVPARFALAQGLLIRSLQASVADDEALVAWTVARRDGVGNAQASLDEVNRIGAQATALKQQFLREYGRQRQAATGRTPASLPDIF